MNKLYLNENKKSICYEIINLFKIKIIVLS